MRQFLF